jgi:GH15 family glucan-1,4-alpha-glucosidase
VRLEADRNRYVDYQRSFWLADNLVLQGRREEAREIFERLLSLRNDVGLLSEEYEPAAKHSSVTFRKRFRMSRS